jgi:hypothetical protein
MSGLRGTSKAISDFDPRLIGGCIVWADSSQLSGTTGATVSSWPNLAIGSTYTISSTGTYNKGGRNGRNTVLLVATSASAGQNWQLSSSPTPSRYSLFWSGRQTGTNSINGRVLQSPVNNQLFGYWGGLKRTLYVTNSAATAGDPSILSGPLSDTVWDVFSHTRIAGGQVTFNWYGSSVYTAGTSSTVNLAGLGINFGGECSSCEIGEIILYSNVLNSYQVQAVEGYLAWKWGVQTSFPTTHSFYYRQPYARNFIPLDIPSCVKWLDPANVGTLTLSTSNVTAIADSSTAGTSATRYNGSVYATTATVAGNNILSFPGSGIVYRTNLILPGAAYTVFVVLSLVSFTGNGSGYQRAINVDSGDGTIFLGALNSNVATFCGSVGFNDVQINTNPTVNLITSTGLHIVCMVTQGAVLTPYTDGTAQGAHVGSTGTGLTIQPYLDIGAYQDAAQQQWNGLIGDILIYSTALSLSQRQQVEGYLATKWSIRSKLPSTHPFYSFPPLTILPFSPNNINGCVLWLDANDTNGTGSTVALGTTITSWIDKSSLLRGACTASPTNRAYTILNYSGLSMMQFTNASTSNNSTYYLTNSTNSNVAASGISVFFVANNPATQTGLTNPFWLSFSSSFYFFWNTAANQYVYVPVSPYNFTTGTTTGGSNFIFFASISPGRVASTAGGTLSYSVNGQITPSTTTGYGVTTAFPAYIGVNYVGAGGVTAAIGEVIVYAGLLSTSQRQQVEGYLAWKWAIRSSLPSAHPFYKYIADTKIEESLVTSGLILNLDPQSYVAAAGTWVPIIGNTWNVIGSPTLSLLNGYNILTFNGTSQYCTDPTGVNFTAAWSINIWINLKAVATAGNILEENGGSSGYAWTDLYVTGSVLYVGTFQINNVSLGTPSANTWYNICFTNTANGSSTLVTYINGVVFSTTAYTRTAPTASPYLSNFYITGSTGNVNYGYKAFSMGVMNFYTIALSGVQVKQNYNALCSRYGLPLI